MVTTAAAVLLLTVGSPPQAATDLAAVKATMADIRNVGTAMLSWLVDQITDIPADSLISPEPSPEPPDPSRPPDPLDWSACPLISAADLGALLVPAYLQEVPQEDGWGNEFEFCLERYDYSRSTLVLGVRSAGRDGLFQRGDYAPGHFDPTDFDEDVAWADGFFVRWPRNAAGP